MSQRIHTPRRTAAAKPVVRRRSMPGALRGFNWRWVSLLLVLAITGTLIFIDTDSMFRIKSAEIGGTRYIPADEIFTAAQVAGLNIVTVDPAEVERRLEQSPSIQSAQVGVAWPARVIIIVQEREPALVWEQGGERYWVDVNGNLMPLRRDLPNLVRVVNEGDAIPFRCPGVGCTGASANSVGIDPAVVLGAQQLKTLRSNIDVLYYDPVHGLSYQDGRGWRGYFGTGTDMAAKLAVYETLVTNLMARGVQPVKIDVSSISAPYYLVGQ